ncbi:MAG: LLM class flavin-dependent oxidoreductase [Candidatus Hodarchaeales archaeon]
MPTYGGWFRTEKLEEPSVSFDNVKNAALKAETLGFDSIWVPDHLLNPLKGENAPTLEAWTTLTALAVLTKNVKLAHTTLCQGFRNPAVLAKKSATLSEISKGRFILSIGAGWYKREFEAYGAPWHEHDERVDRTREQIEIMKALWTDKETYYNGNYFTIDKGILEPKPNPIPEIWYGGESEASKSLLKDHCDGWLIYPSSSNDIKEKILFINKEANRKIQVVGSSQLIVAKTDEEAENKLKSFAGGNTNVINHVLNTGIVGSPDTVENKLIEFKETGLDHLLLQFSQTVADLEFFEKITI